MKYLLSLILVLSIIPYCYADRVCLEKSTGKLIEYQSGGSTQIDLDVMVQNAVNGGYKKENVETKFVTPEIWKEIEYEQIIKPAQVLAKQKEMERQAKKETIKTKLKLTDEDFKNLKEALGK